MCNFRLPFFIKKNHKNRSNQLFDMRISRAVQVFCPLLFGRSIGTARQREKGVLKQNIKKFARKFKIINWKTAIPFFYPQTLILNQRNNLGRCCRKCFFIWADLTRNKNRITCVWNGTSQTMLIRFKTAPKRIELQERA